MLVIVWEYEVKRERVDDFESFFRPDGPWTGFFRGSPAFLSTTLMRDLRKPGRYMVADRWMSESMYEEFKTAHRQAYDQLSERGHRLIENETELGRFDFLE